eukprot:CAMPEP_0172644544 /NCGR_PEP_ID=MMETSP1068-20121228/239267_1 /TAXON_ID=35684 /ORGANISM="Pseudopedinella elastica, Strain CCMP716" /LENGTH=424 /DNA_ID=CAMNT_0013458745 /DNA_START=239 /DNA_END=1513 /DNA_ORIENTATION=-
MPDLPGNVKVPVDAPRGDYSFSDRLFVYNEKQRPFLARPAQGDRPRPAPHKVVVPPIWKEATVWKPQAGIKSNPPPTAKPPTIVKPPPLAITTSSVNDSVGALSLVTRTKSEPGPRVCHNVRAYLVQKQLGNDPSLPGPGQYHDSSKPPINNKGQNLRSSGGIKFCESNETRSLAKPNSANEPGPGQYINPLKFGRGPDGELRSVLSSQKTAPRYRMVRVTSAKDGRAMNKPGSEKEPGPGQYIDPRKPGVTNKGEQLRSVYGSRWGERPKSASNARAMNKPGSEKEPGPGEYIDPRKPGVTNKGVQLRSVHGSRWGERPKSASNARAMNKPGSEKEPGPGEYINPVKQWRADDGTIKAVLSTDKGTPSVSFGSPPKPRVRPKSAGALRSTNGPGFFLHTGDEKILSKYKHRGAVGFGPAGKGR